MDMCKCGFTNDEDDDDCYLCPRYILSRCDSAHKKWLELTSWPLALARDVANKVEEKNESKHLSSSVDDDNKELIIPKVVVVVVVVAVVVVVVAVALKAKTSFLVCPFVRLFR